ncbi:MatE family protein [Tritrichomonas foetus]|uniref:MatE family protein n=1 Tax=Tritrichomonas foetus TaxID=1144522 RepID=A0A1J4K3I8_9EUKA|nr:MatE family protein [Tritrichomonas foetus]|eukprot:OHT05400.1 MatE family protein [Tritrichomonas foetus]
MSGAGYKTPLLPVKGINKRSLRRKSNAAISPKLLKQLDSMTTLSISENYDGKSRQDGDGNVEDMKLFTDNRILRSLLILSSGPFIAQVALSFYGIINMMWVAKAIGDLGIAAIGAVVIVEFFANSVAIYLNTCICIQVSYLFGCGKKEICEQLLVDFIRVCFIFGAILPAAILPTAKYLIRWFGAEDEIMTMAIQYLFPSQLGCSMLFLFYTVCGFLEATGHMWLYAIVQVAAFGLNMFGFNPMLLLGFKLPIWAASLSTVISESTPTLIIVVMIFMGKFSVKPKIKMFFKCFVKDTFIALNTGIADLIEAFSIDLSLVVMQKFIDNAATKAGCLEAVLGVWSIIDKLEQIISCVSNGIGEGLLPLASYAYGAKDYKRVAWLMFHSLWVMCSWAAVISIALIIFPTQIASIWSTDPEFLYWAKKMIRIYAYTGVLTAVDYTIPIMLMAMQKPCAASCVSVFALLIPQPICAAALYYTKKDDPARIIWTFDISDLFSLVVGIIFMIKPIHEIRKSIKKSKENTLLKDDMYVNPTKPENINRYTDLLEEDIT